MILAKEKYSEEEKWTRNTGASMGTTIIAVAFKDGVILGADSRTSMGTYISNRVSRKITRLAEGIYVCRSGSAADTQAIADIVADKMGEELLCFGEKPLVNDAATFSKKIIHQNPHLSAGLIVAGVDRTGPHIFSVSPGGSILEQNCAMGGSGSLYIAGLCDSLHQEDMSREEAVSFVKKVISHAMYRDNSSGGCIRMIIIDAAGVEENLFLAGNTLTVQ
jgi:20S proteasome subunit beta 1